MTLVLFIDELQYMYPEYNQKMDEETLEMKISFIKEICELAGGGYSLVIAAGSSVTLVDKPLHQMSSDTRISKYPKLNDQKMVPITLLPITERDDFEKSLKLIKIQHENSNINEIYIKTGGIIGNK